MTDLHYNMGGEFLAQLPGQFLLLLLELVELQQLCTGLEGAQFTIRKRFHNDDGELWRGVYLIL